MGADLYLYNRMPGTVWGANSEFVSCGRLDDLECAFTSMKFYIVSYAITACYFKIYFSMF